MSNLLDQLHQELLDLAKNSKHNSAMFFKQGAGDYAEHDTFVGIKNPDLRKLAKKYRDIDQSEMLILLHSPYNEYRLLALFFMVERYQKGSAKIKDQMYQIYIQNLNFVNNWNLVDASAQFIVGPHLYHNFVDSNSIKKLINSDNLWHRRIAIIALLYHIRQNSFDMTLDLSEKLLHDKQDLIHKAVGWMLREVGKGDRSVLKSFLNTHAHVMPRVMLRYAIEHFDNDERQHYLKK